MVRLAASVLDGFPVEALRLPAETVGLLHQLGIRRIGQLDGLGRGELTARFGPRLVARWDQATGRMAEAIHGCRTACAVEVSQSVEPPSGRQEVVEGVCETLIERLAGTLERAGQGVMGLECGLGCLSGVWVNCAVDLFQPTVAVGHLMELLRLRLERVRLPAPVERVRMQATVTAALTARQEVLFDDHSAWLRRQQLAVLIERLANRLGRRRVLRPRLVSDAQPELAYVYDPWVDPVGGQRARRAQAGDERAMGLPLRPLRLYPRPVSVEVVAVMPDGPPVGFRWRACHFRIARSWGPERIETGWWRGRPVGRDYYGVQTTTGHRFWLFRRLRDGKWFLHGVFE
ncbi:MAG TPA: hypothetical protein EYP56_03120 [Planctomycetaceae bacterium]|nr:hypothetical protein [Planctomycetaceae bacterium]HIQ21722.1 hypothetical protein [Planctomycetota bacterium]